MDLKNDYIIVTGGAGFVGKWLCEKLVSIGHKILVIDNLSNGTKSNFIKSIEYFDIDISNSKSFNNIPNYKFNE